MRLATALIAGAVLLHGAAASASTAVPCWSVRIPVAIEPGGRAHHSVVGKLCRPPAARSLQVLLSGGTYGRVYWDFPSRSGANSYVRAMSSAGLATLNLDRLGIGESDRPPAPALSVGSGAFVTHQIVQAARAGRLGAPFQRVVTVGHSLGSAMALVEAARHRDVDGLILSGFLAHARPVGAPELVTALQPAQLDSRLADRPLGYLTTRPGTREGVFYAGSGADRDVIATDERTKETISATELATISAASQPRIDAGIRVPVLSVVGEFDNVFCATSCAAPGSPAPAEAAHYPNAPSFETFVLSQSGHVVNLHRKAPRWFTAATAWMRRVVAGPGLPVAQR